MPHLIKLSVGPRDVEQLRAIQASRIESDPPLRHRTRMFPKRAAEILAAGGSIYWVVAGFVRVRQRILDIREEKGADGITRAGLVLDPELVAVEARPLKPFQGWRYLAPEAAPPDLRAGAVEARGLDALPAGLRRELRDLGLL
ncbi:DUF1489 domain-containing protein [Craurococcus roseus]|uniref:DUF1489 domain-containing protein n=1 Tax=Craurococcus roseus TaxID=77585 RepID=A0ABN1FVP6_9PROT